ncbi:LysR family transcriptional regulator [Paracoccus siganidrum]|uniref:LysR family transcriptional regulator n=1 Tax=Paracoccus siganidrum TaxID=1276757 RepID=A0A419A4J3_9RHOB|nr:LysR family transcriptional regulator [Paracoccus siganidrum]RJL09654.1 LysR family transcriptional regulator [Paracoccus siganidrum]RMC35831.1 LysR family transcriptional regulator [Paracoccus siganidrum]
MVRRYYDLPSLSALAMFEAAARHSSVKLAAQELNVTPGAVSRQIKSVELELGEPLFLRNGKGVVLTGAGEELFRALASGFSRTSEVVRSIKAGETSNNVAIACSDVFATMWLIPRMPDVWTRHPRIFVDHVIWENARNYRRSDVELRVQYGLGSWVDETAELHFDDWIYPVCSPEFARRHAGATIGDLADLPLLSVEWVESDWLGWEEALLRGGVRAGALRGRRFGKFSIALQAAMADQGLVIGWHRMVGPLVEQGALVRFSDLVVPAPGGYYLTWNSTRRLSDAAALMRGWIGEQARLVRAMPRPVGARTDSVTAISGREGGGSEIPG